MLLVAPSQLATKLSFSGPVMVPRTPKRVGLRRGVSTRLSSLSTCLVESHRPAPDASTEKIYTGASLVRRFSGNNGGALHYDNNEGQFGYGRNMDPEIMSLVREYSALPPTSTSLQSLLRVGQGDTRHLGDIIESQRESRRRPKQPVSENSQRYQGSTAEPCLDTDLRLGTGVAGNASKTTPPGTLSSATGALPRSAANLFQRSSDLLQGDLWMPRERGEQQKNLAQQLGSFVRQEIPVRLAHRIQDLDEVPSMRDMPSVQKVKGIYVNSFLELLDSPGTLDSPQDENDFARLLHKLYENHSSVLVRMARGAFELREAVRRGEIVGTVDENGTITSFEHMESCHKFLDRFYLSRIGIRVLAGHYLALRPQYQQIDAGSWQRKNESDRSLLQSTIVGLIDRLTSPSALVREAADDVTRMSVAQYGIAPRIVLSGRLDLTFPYIPTYLRYVVLEVLKNAVRATVETHGNRVVSTSLRNIKTVGAHGALSNDLPSVTVVIADGTDNEGK
jgi:Mitochondrial branched-chain alpha-ketoacid dehydrogenase kinase